MKRLGLGNIWNYMKKVNCPAGLTVEWTGFLGSKDHGRGFLSLSPVSAAEVDGKEGKAERSSSTLSPRLRVCMGPEHLPDWAVDEDCLPSVPQWSVRTYLNILVFSSPEYWEESSHPLELGIWQGGLRIFWPWHLRRERSKLPDY